MTDAPNDATTPVFDGASDTLRTMVDAAVQAGALLVAASQRRTDLRVDEKSAGDFVSEADRSAEALIADVLMGAYPAYGWLGEETGARTGRNSDLRWIVDPLDGTTNFLRGLPHWAVSIALCRGEDVLCAVVHDPSKAETFVAERGAGAHLNGLPITVTKGIALDAALFATGVPAGGRITYLPDCLGDLERLMPRSAGVRRWGAAALDLAYVAAGRYDGYWERNLGAWDVAAGMLLVQEAGGRIAPLWPSHSVLSSGSFVASNADLGDALAAQIGRRSDCEGWHG
ncbi:inositol monophosphatase family protein [uncultured Sulfitobacter sp.]|uniref:inositol monophosphatase family protein n=1 Tax=uncultured Sulfitobacter sp. TaxID=191468 RepID=UPI00262D6EAA|nr:inositol monophosphatase family protein [uncultured Sulfitobacter sp.]